MKGFDHILVPLDFSESSTRIVETALRVLAPGGRITLFHAVEWLPVVQEGTFGVYAHRKDIDKIKALSQQKLEAIAKRHDDVSMDVVVREGKPASTILESAESLGPDLIVMGTHGRSRLDHLLIGSVAERVVRKASGAVLLVRYVP